MEGQIFGVPLEKVKVSNSWLSGVRLFENPWTIALDYSLLCPWNSPDKNSGVGSQPFPPPRDLPDSGVEPGSPPLQADSLLSKPPGSSLLCYWYFSDVLSITIIHLIRMHFRFMLTWFQWAMKCYSYVAPTIIAVHLMLVSYCCSVSLMMFPLSLRFCSLFFFLFLSSSNHINVFCQFRYTLVPFANCTFQLQNSHLVLFKIFLSLYWHSLFDEIVSPYRAPLLLYCMLDFL